MPYPDEHEADLSPAPPATPVGKRETFLAAGILALCLVTAVSTWIYGVRPKAETPEPSSGFSGSLFQEKADLGVIVVEGTILHQASSTGFGGGNNAASDRIVQQIRQAEKDGVKGLLLKINSPGGTASASQSVYGEIQRVRKNGKMRVISAMGDVAASGGYYIAAATEKIYANPATLTGSIGVISQSTKVKGLFEKVGLEAEVIKSGEFKDMGSPYRPTTAAERQLLQDLINDTYNDFVSAVAAGRKLPEARVRQLGDGRIYTGNQALKHKLVDALGDYNVALAELRKLTQTGEEAKVRDYSKPGFEELVGMLGTRIQGLSPTASLEQLTMMDLRHLHKVPLMLYY